MNKKNKKKNIDNNNNKNDFNRISKTTIDSRISSQSNGIIVIGNDLAYS